MGGGGLPKVIGKSGAGRAALPRGVEEVTGCTLGRQNIRMGAGRVGTGKALPGRGSRGPCWLSSEPLLGKRGEPGWSEIGVEREGQGTPSLPPPSLAPRSLRTPKDTRGKGD